MGDMRHACKILIGKLEGKRLLGNMGVDEDNNKMGLNEMSVRM
jgi:hypothetical protein